MSFLVSISWGSPHVRPIGRACGEPNEIELTATPEPLNGVRYRYELEGMRYADHGPIFLPDGTPPTYVNSLVVGKDGHLYFLGKLPNGRTELMRVGNPHAKE